MRYGLALHLLGITLMIPFVTSCGDINFTHEGYLNALR